VLLHPHIAHYYENRGVRVVGCTDACTSNETPVIDVLINFDEHDDQEIDVIVCFRTPPPLIDNKQHLGPSLGSDLELIERLNGVLGCNVDVSREHNLKKHYPVTYMRTMSSHSWNEYGWESRSRPDYPKLLYDVGKSKTKSCSFCRMSGDQSGRIIAGPTACVCDHCLQLFTEIVPLPTDDIQLFRLPRIGLNSCSFCGECQNFVNQLIGGFGKYICDQCIKMAKLLCNDDGLG